MADTAVVSAPAPTAAGGKAKKPRKTGTAKPKKPSDHPKYSQMIKDALAVLKERGGSSRQAILKYIAKHYRIGGDEKTINAHLKLALRAGVKNGTLKQSKGTGASGSFRIGEKKTSEKKPKAKTAKKAGGAAKPKKAKKPAGAKPAKKAKAAGSPKKAVKAKPAKPKAAKKAAKPKSPKKTKAAKPKKARSPAKAKKPKAAKAKK